MKKPRTAVEDNVAAQFYKTLGEILRRLDPDNKHVAATPDRVLRFYREFLTGYKTRAEDLLSASYASSANQMVHVDVIDFNSLCAHHLLPFYGTAHFAYIPNRRVVGLSKIPRLIDMYARRLQIQEDMTEQIVNAFHDIIRPQGCGLMVIGSHTCCTARGVMKQRALMTTTALRGCFEEPAVKMEFLSQTKVKL